MASVIVDVAKMTYLKLMTLLEMTFFGADKIYSSGLDDQHLL